MVEIIHFPYLKKKARKREKKKKITKNKKQKTNKNPVSPLASETGTPAMLSAALLHLCLSSSPAELSSLGHQAPLAATHQVSLCTHCTTTRSGENTPSSVPLSLCPSVPLSLPLSPSPSLPSV